MFSNIRSTQPASAMQAMYAILRAIAAICVGDATICGWARPKTCIGGKQQTGLDRSDLKFKIINKAGLA
jgi:hypothetical protein